MTNKCNFCGSINSVFVDYISSTLCEETVSCKKCGYEYQFSYGYTQINWGSIFFLDYNYSEKKDIFTHKRKLENKYDKLYKYLWRFNSILKYIL